MNRTASFIHKFKFIKLSILSFLMCCFAISVSAQTAYKYWFAKDGVEFYTRQSTSNKNELCLKIKNTRSSKVDVSFSTIEWIASNANIVGKGGGATISLKGGQEKSGEQDGLFFLTPTNYTVSEVTYRLIGLEIKWSGNGSSGNPYAMPEDR